MPELRLYRDHPRQLVGARTRDGAWERVARGAYVTAGMASTPRERALARIAAVEARLVAPHWFSHESAALLWGLPMWRVPDVTHVRQPGRPGDRKSVV
jgi:predicted transcriptional regulator of viral defense system